MGSGGLDFRAQIKRGAAGDDGFTTKEIFADHGTPVWASKHELTDKERVRAGQVQAAASVRFIIRWSMFSFDITSKDRIEVNGVEYNITAIRDIGRRQWREITAMAQV